jgi:ATP-binding cassette, subfamily C (CFTR/MRP), member 1
MAKDTPVEAEFSIPGSVSDQWPSAGVVEFENVWMKYRPELPPSLLGLTFVTGPGEKIGICGRTGAGKSRSTTTERCRHVGSMCPIIDWLTEFCAYFARMILLCVGDMTVWTRKTGSLVAALLRMVEIHSGVIKIDGVDVSKVGLWDLRRKVSVVSQDPVIFAGTMRANLDPTGVQTDAMLMDVLRRVRLVDDDTRITLEMQISSGGGNLSSGERQLLTLARAIVIGARVVILDEATSYVDGATDQKIQATIKKELVDCTLLTIAHRLDTIAGCDKIMVMDKGSCVEWGSPSTLIEDPESYFAKLVEETGLQSTLLRSRISTKSNLRAN